MLAQSQFGCEISSRTVCRRILLENLEKTAQSCSSAPTPSQKASLVDNGLFSDCEKPAMCHWIGLHHMLVMFASQSHASAQMCTAAHLWECTSALASGHWWSRWCLRPVLDSGHMLEEVLWSVKVQLMKNQKSGSEDYSNKVKLPQQNLFIAKF